MAIVILILCLVGAMAGAQRPTDNQTSTSPHSTVIGVATSMPPSTAKIAICDSTHSHFRDLSVPYAAQTIEAHIEVCHDD